MPPEYRDFFLIVNGSPTAYTVEAQGPGQIWVPPQRFSDWAVGELGGELERIKEGSPPTSERMKAVGRMLFDALFPRPIIRAFERVHDALPPGVNLRIKLVVRPPELGHLPWELLYDPDHDVFLATQLSSPIVRFVESGRPVSSLLAKRPLRVLLVQANPLDTGRLDILTSERTLREALGRKGWVRTVRATTPSMLRDTLREQPGFHVLHYDGHAAFDVERGTGILFLHDEAGTTHGLDGERMASYLDGTAVRLVVLSACETARDSTQRRFSGIAHQLMHASKLPAVIAMQFAIADSSAAAFTQEFYRALADDYPVDAATTEGRKAILDHLGGGAGALAAPDWATPVLLMRSSDGQIFDVGARERAADTSEPEAGEPPDRDGGVKIQFGDVNRSKIDIRDVAGGNLVKGASEKEQEKGWS